MRNANRFTAKGYTNRAMNTECYTLRSVVMGFIYEAKESVILPRVDVRITDKEAGEEALGMARMGHNIIWIEANTLKDYCPDAIRHIVFHELCHAVGSTPHMSTCKLMGPTIGNKKGSHCTKEEAHKALRKHLG